jgi:hypothetical protein
MYNEGKKTMGVVKMESNVIMLTGEERELLEKYVTTGVHSARLIRRARAILALDRSTKKGHLRITRVCKEVGISRSSLYDVRNDYLKAASIEEFLSRKKRETPPIEPKITGDVEARIIALACSEPPEGYARWTVMLLANKVVELNYIDNISHMSVHRVLKKTNLSLI